MTDLEKLYDALGIDASKIPQQAPDDLDNIVDKFCQLMHTFYVSLIGAGFSRPLASKILLTIVYSTFGGATNANNHDD